ncbi:nitrate reductase [NADPH]-like isoform X2 [Spodoptera litura]|uniref:Cytochrome b5 n=1 Tax=Spodoptera litura TaxID=69820 RepID=A0A9J7ITG1_SPOLT|nr:nitrate reductase [NADPH]-like isoform X2 [Spodoptera litura]
MSKILTADEVKRHNTRKSVWMVIRNEVYDVTAFIDEHPGGEDPILEAAGQDATIAFEDVGHSEDAKAMLKKYKIGTLAPGEGCCKMRAQIWRSSSPYHRDCTECNASSDMPGTSDSKSWRSFDGGTPSSVSRKSSLKCFKEPGPPRHERRIQRIVVPKERFNFIYLYIFFVLAIKFHLSMESFKK